MKKYKLTKDELILFGITVTNNIRDFVMAEDDFVDDFLLDTGLEVEKEGRYKVGDSVVVMANNSCHDFEIGEIVTITEHRYLDTWYCEDKDGNTYGLEEAELSEPFTRLK